MGGKFFTQLSVRAGAAGLFMNPNIAECVVDWVPLGGRVCLLKLRLQERSLLQRCAFRRCTYFM